MGATTEDGEEINSGSTKPERIKPTEETFEFEENNMSLPQDADCYTGIQDQKPVDGIFPMFNMPQRPTSNALNTDNKEAEEQHRNACDSALTSSSQEPLPDTMDDTSEPIQGTREVLHTDKPVDLEVDRPRPTEIMELLDKRKNDAWDAMFETLVKEMQLGDSDMKKQDPHINPDVDLLDEEGYTSLYKAALVGHLEIVDDLISQGANPDKPSKGGLTPLHAAAQEGHKDIVDYLILQGADVNVECEKGRTPFHTAAEKGHTNIMDSFLAEGIDVGKKDNTGQTPFLAAVKYGQLKAVNYLIAKGAKQSKFEGMTSLYISAQSGLLDMVRFLISQGADVNEENDSGQVPLHAAASRGHLDVISFLLDHGADVNKAALSGWTPFHAAVSNGHLKVVKYLRSNGANDTRFDEMTPLYIAARAGHLDIVKFLISQGHDANEFNSSGHTPFHGAAMRGHSEVTKYLIQHEADTAMGEGRIPFHATGINCQPYFTECISTENTEKLKLNAGKTSFDIAVECSCLDLVTACNSERKRVNEKNNKGEIPLHAAVRRGCIESTIFLILLGADVNKKDDMGTTPLLAAIQSGHVEVVKYLKAKGAKNTRVHGMTQLYIAAQSGNLDMVKFLISQGADVNEENDSGQIPLHGAASRGHFEVIKVLVGHGANVNKETKSGWTPFHAAISNGHLGVVQYSTDKGVHDTKFDKMTPLNITARAGQIVGVVQYLTDKGVHDTKFDKMTPLYIAARAGLLDVVKFFISQGRDVNELNCSGLMPFHGAADRGHFEVMEYLIRHGADMPARKMQTTSHPSRRNCQADFGDYISAGDTKTIKLKEKTSLYIAVEHGRLDLVKDCISKGAHVNGSNSIGEVSLHAAARSGCIEITKYLILLGADVNKKDDRGITPLLVAIHKGHVEVANYLKTMGAQDSKVYGMTSLYIAAQSGHLDMVRFLISQGADVNEENDSGQIPLHGAASRGHLDVIKFLLGHGSEVNKVTKSGWTPFHAAISNGHLDVVEYLTDNLVLHAKFDEMTPLYIAARAGHLDVVKFLISQGHDVNELNSSGYSAFHGADIMGHQHVMDYLIGQAEVKRTAEALGRELYNTASSNSQPEVVKFIYTEETGKKEKTPLYIAVECGRLDLVENWIKRGAHVNGTNSNGEVPLHAAARNGNLEVTRYLIRQGANLEKKDDVGTTPFLVAIHSGHLEVVKYLKTKGAQTSRIHGMTPLYIAAQSGHLDIVKFLISQEADVNEQNDSGQVPLHAAANEGHLEVLQFLVKHGANVNKETLTGSTPFFCAVSNGHLEVVKYLCTMGACMTRCHGMTPLYIAAQNGHSKVIQFLIEEGANVNDENISGRSPLHAASYNGYLDIVICLAGENAHVNAKDRDGWTPLHAAAQEGHKDVVIYLINIGADINAKDVEGLSPLLHLSNPDCRHSWKYPTTYGDDASDEDSQSALISGNCQEHGESTNISEAAANESIKGGKEQFSGSGANTFMPTALHCDDTVKNSQDSSSYLDPVKRGNRYAPYKSAEEETKTITSNYETPTDTKERKEGDMSPFAHAKPKCPVNNAHTSLSLETESSSHTSHKQLDTKYAGTALQHGSFKWKQNQVKAPFLHFTEKTAHQEVTHVQSGRGMRREDNRKMKVPCLIKFRGNTGQPLKDDPKENMSAGKHGKMRTEALQDQISPEDCTPTIDSISAGSTRDSRNKRRTPDRRFPPSLVLLQIFIRMVVVVAIIQTGRPVLAGGSPRSELVTLQAGKTGVIPFYIPRPADNTSQITAYYTLRFESKLRPFCINGNRDIEGFKSPSQITRFDIIMTEMTTFYSVNLNVNSVDTVDQDIYILTLIFHGLENVLVDMLTKEVLVNIPPGPAQCFITLSESSNCPYEVHCQATTGNVETTLTCYQDSQRVEMKGDITNSGHIIRGVFLLPHNTHFSCCSHDVTSEVNVTMCNDFEWPPSKNSMRHPATVSDPSLTPSVANTIFPIGNTDEQVSKSLVESQVDSGTIKHYMVPSVSLTMGLMISLFLC